MRAGHASILLVALSLVTPGVAWDTCEDFTRAGWVHTDNGDDLSVAAYVLTSSLVTETQGATHIRDYGADHFATFTHRFQFQADLTYWSTYAEGRMGYANSADYWPNVPGPLLWVRIFREGSATQPRVSLVGTDANTIEINLADDARYYAELSRNATSGTATLTVWTGGYNQTLFGSISAPCSTSGLRYCHAWNARTGDAGNVPLNLYSLDMQRAAPPDSGAWYVSAAQGNDLFDGHYPVDQGDNYGGPFATINYAVQYGPVTAGHTIYVRTGTYAETATFAKGGSAGSPLTVRRYGTETVTVDGSYAIPAAAWSACTQASDALGNSNWANMYYTTLPAGPLMNSNLYQGSDYLNLAQDGEPSNRWHYYDRTNWHQRATGITRTTITDANLPTYGGASIVGAYVAVHTTSNTVRQSQVTNWDSGTNTITFGDLGADPAIYTDYGKYIYAIFSCPSDYVFDDAGEYVINTSRYCVVWPWNSANLTTEPDGTVSVTTRADLFDLSSYGHITLDGLSFRRGYQQAIDGSGSNVTIKNCTFTQCSGVDGPATNHVNHSGSYLTFQNNSLSYGRGQLRGLVANGGSDVLWTGNTITQYTGTCIYSAGGDRNQILGNTIKENFGPHANAIAIQYCADKCLIARNRVVDTPRLTLSYSDNVIICHNVFDHAVWDGYWLSDNGNCSGYLRAFNNTMLGPGTYYFVKSLSSSWTTSTFQNNLIDSTSAVPSVHTYNVFTSDNHWTLGTGESVNYSEASLITDWAGEDYTPVDSGDLHDAGTDVSALFDSTNWPSFNFALDLNGNTRSGTWDIGAVEREAGPPPSTNHYLLMRSGS